MEKKQPGANKAGNAEPHLTTSVMALVRNMFGLLLNRIELAALELSEVRASVLKLAAVFAIALIAGWFAVAYWSVLLVYLAWDALGWKILLIVAGIFTVITGALLLYMRTLVRDGKLSMPATMNELRNDRDALL